MKTPAASPLQDQVTVPQHLVGWLVGWLVKLAYRRAVSEEVVAGTEIPGGEGRWRLYLTLHCHHQNNSCIEVGSDESHLNVSFIVRGKVTKTSP